jgi:hypothetical protein
VLPFLPLFTQLPVIGYDEDVMQRASNIMQVIFWTSVPLFGVCVAVSWSLGVDPLAWPGRALWLVVLASSACLTPQAFPPVSDEGVPREPWTYEPLVFPITLLVASSLYAYDL